MNRSWSLKFVLVLALSAATAWAALKATADERHELELRQRTDSSSAVPPAGRERARVGPGTGEPALRPDIEGRGTELGTSHEDLAQSVAECVAPQVEPPSGGLPGPDRDLRVGPTIESSTRAHDEGSGLLPPDLLQTDPALGLPGGGMAYCGPVAVSNGLVWLSQRGFDALVPPGETPRQQQLALVRQISEVHFMATSQYGGTGPLGVLRGLSRWVKRAGYEIRRLEYQGWRGHQPQFSTGQKHPQIPWIAQALEEGGAAWLHVGWYHRKKYYPGLRRRGGHWLTVAAVEPWGDAVGSSESSSDAAALRVRDSAPYAGEEPTLERVVLRRLEEGWLFDGDAGLPAEGYYALSSGLSLKRAEDIPVIDGAVVLTLSPEGEQ